MQKTVLTFGLISGFLILVIGYAAWTLTMGEDGKMNMNTGMILGYANMLISLSMIFFGIRQYRERYLGGKISFGKAFKVGILIALIASAMYTIGWMVYFNTSDVAQTFPAQYIDHIKAQWEASGMAANEISQKVDKMKMQMDAYGKNPVIMAGMTLMEIFPVGLIITLISALILKRK